MDEELTGYKQGWMAKLVAWQKEHISDKQMTLILAFLIGLLASVAGFFLHAIVHEIQFLLTSGFEQGTYNLLFLLFPIVGIYLTSLFIKYVVRDNISHGITRVLYAISTKNSRLKGHNCWSSVVASGITIGFGGSVGAEAPIVLTGSAIGSNLGQIFRMDKKTMMLLVGCGALLAADHSRYSAPGMEHLQYSSSTICAECCRRYDRCLLSAYRSNFSELHPVRADTYQQSLF